MSATANPLKLLFHDYGGHAHTARLARALCRYGFDVSFVSFQGFSTPKGSVCARPDDPKNFSASQIGISAPFDKDNLARRMLQQREYARALRAFALAEAPDVIISSNSPLEVQQALLSVSRKRDTGFVFWCQDIHSEAIGRILGRKSRLLGRLAGSYYRQKERRLLRRSDAVIVIADAFKDLLAGAPWGLDPSPIKVIENIAPIEDVPQYPRENAWSLANMRPGRRRIVYTGTLARKHNPDMVLALARALDVDVWLFSEGSSPGYVAAQAKAEGLQNLFVRPWLSVEDLPKALAAADILFAAIEADAGVYSVPSKILSYLAAGRPIMASLPTQNLAGQTILRAGAGLINEPDDRDGLIGNAERLLGDAELRAAMGQNGRRHAEANFDMETFAARFAPILQSAAAGGGNRLRPPKPAIALEPQLTGISQWQ
ncbi:MAG TPA: glycosyltransferase family 4 protein [Arsenicitalea sp.]|jgi:glycosyltransferase involved in cell wall biosynthesis|nr:glycosyltransferase family 4 protein [Arsenicitalea sp.]